ncbi:MAG: DUF1924 domain-containing protein [Pseudomonadales bacterium]|nr:DUF1924 domain-containing protein [Pseudomonadales bacterium]
MFLLFIFLLLINQASHADNAIPEMMKTLNPEGTLIFDADHGQQMWTQEHPGKDGKSRSCTTCHGTDLTIDGKHARSGKVIKPMAVSVNQQRFTKTKKINKWFKRNCKWTWGRECTAQEKGDFLQYFQEN